MIQKDDEERKKENYQKNQRKKAHKEPFVGWKKIPPFIFLEMKILKVNEEEEEEIKERKKNKKL